MASELSRLIDDELEKVDREQRASESKQNLRTSLRIKTSPRKGALEADVPIWKQLAWGTWKRLATSAFIGVVFFGILYMYLLYRGTNDKENLTAEYQVPSLDDEQLVRPEDMFTTSSDNPSTLPFLTAGSPSTSTIEYNSEPQGEVKESHSEESTHEGEEESRLQGGLKGPATPPPPHKKHIRVHPPYPSKHHSSHPTPKASHQPTKHAVDSLSTATLAPTPNARLQILSTAKSPLSSPADSPAFAKAPTTSASSPAQSSPTGSSLLAPATPHAPAWSMPLTGRKLQLR